jgi:hypothetical protein
MLFEQARVTGLFGLENRKGIFEEVDSRFKFVVLTFKKGGTTASFPTTFMRQDISELERFPFHGAIDLPVKLIRRFSPDSLSVPEIRTPEDLEIASKLANFPMLSDPISGWGLEIYGEELHMNRGSAFFQMQRTSFPLYEGGMIWQFDHRHAEPRYWIDEAKLRKEFLKKRVKRIPHLYNVPKDMRNDYETHRLAIRKIASSTNERTLITTIIPKNVFTGNSLAVNFPFRHEKDHYNELRISNAELLVLLAILNSFVADYILRSRMTTNLNTFFLYQLPIVRPSRQESIFLQLQSRSAKLICTAPEFDDLANEVGLKSHWRGVTDATGRSELRAELDGLVAHLYGLTEEEFAHILSTFPLVPDPIKVAAQNAYRDVERGLLK